MSLNVISLCGFHPYCFLCLACHAQFSMLHTEKQEGLVSDSGALRTGKVRNGYQCRDISDADISTCEQHNGQSEGVNKTTVLGLSKNTNHANQMTSSTLWWLPKIVHYGALLSQRRAICIHFEPALSTCILSKRLNLTSDRSAF